MSVVRFATICDRCGSKSPEYLGHTLVCSDCERDVCEKCCKGYDPDPPGRALCKDCWDGQDYWRDDPTHGYLAVNERHKP